MSFDTAALQPEKEGCAAAVRRAAGLAEGPRGWSRSGGARRWSRRRSAVAGASYQRGGSSVEEDGGVPTVGGCGRQRARSGKHPGAQARHRGGATMAEASGRPGGCLQRRRRTGGGLECSARFREERSRLSESRRRFGRNLGRFGALKRPEASSGDEERVGRGGPGTARRGSEGLAGILEMLGGGFGVAAEDRSARGTAAELSAHRGRRHCSGGCKTLN